MLEVPFGCFLTKYHDLGDCYLEILNETSVRLAIKPIKQPHATSQIIVFLDIATNLSEGCDLSPKFFKKLSVAGREFTKLTAECVELIHKTGEVTACLNTPEFTAVDLEGYQIVFHREGERPAFGEAYLDKAVALRNSLR